MDDRAHARELINEALRLCDDLGEHIAAARLQLALDTLPEKQSEHRVREHRLPWQPLE